MPAGCAKTCRRTGSPFCPTLRTTKSPSGRTWRAPSCRFSTQRAVRRLGSNRWNKGTDVSSTQQAEGREVIEKGVGALTLTTPSEMEIVMTREFDAPRELVFEAHISC